MNKSMTFAVSLLAAGIIPGSGLAENVAIIGGKVVTGGPKGTIENGTVLFEDNKISAVAAALAAPEGYRVINAGGRYVTTGLMVPYSSLGVQEISLEKSTVDHIVNSASPFFKPATKVPFSAAFDISHAINPKATPIPVTRIEGITRAVVAPAGTDKIFAGQAAIIDLAGGFQFLTKAKAAMLVEYGISGKDKAGGSRGTAMVYLIKALDEAQTAAQPAKRSRKRAAGAGSGKGSLLHPMDLAALVPVVKGEVPMVVIASRAADLMSLVALKDRFAALDLVVYGGAEAWMVADALAAAGIPVILDPTANLPASFEALGATLENAARLEAAGVTIAIASGGGPGHNSRLIAQAAGIAVAHGLGWNAAFRAITINPARIFGIDDQLGSLEAGKLADVVIWDGDPLELMSSPDIIFINGQETPMVSRQTKLRDRYMDLKNMTDPLAYKK
jgi:imidazolonepropionase-like amidohydrolase